MIALFVVKPLPFFAEPFVQVLQLNPSGKVLRKKRTTTVSGVKEPLFNETLNFDLPPHHVEFMSFVVLLGTKTIDDVSKWRYFDIKRKFNNRLTYFWKNKKAQVFFRS